MKFRKLCTTLAIFTLITSTCAFAQDMSEKEILDLDQQIIQGDIISQQENQKPVVLEQSNNQQEVVEEVIVPEVAPELRNSSILDTKVKSRDYNDYFWCDNSDGETLNIYIKNNGNQSVQHRITHGKKTVRSKGTIKPGQKVQLRLGPDRSGKWTIDVYTTDGSKMNVTVKAEQF